MTLMGLVNFSSENSYFSECQELFLFVIIFSPVDYSDLENCIIPLSYFSHFISWTHTKQRVFKSHPPFVRWSALSSVHVQNVTVKLPNKAAMTNSLNSVIFHSILWCNDLLRKKKWLENNFSSVVAPSYLIGAVELKLHLHLTKLGVYVKDCLWKRSVFQQLKR